MLARKLQHLPPHVYPPEEWRLVEKRFYPKLLAQMETLFATANGWLGMRGCHYEGEPVYENGTFVNGFHDTWPIVYGENAFGFAKTGQTIVNVPDSKTIRLYIDDEPFQIHRANLIHYEQALDMRAGTLNRELVWEMHSGKQVRLRASRLVSLVHRHVAAIDYEVTLLNADAPVIISSELVYRQANGQATTDPRATRAFADRVLVPGAHSAKGFRIVMAYRTRNSDIGLACGIDHSLETECEYTKDSRCDEDHGKVVFSCEARQGMPIRLTKLMTYHSSRSAPTKELCERTERALNRVMVAGFEKLVADQRHFLDEFWRNSDVQVKGDPALQQVIRFNLFHICQASARAENVGIPAKGLTGQGYEGQYFWDTEIYVLPFLIYTAPRIAKNLLLFRYRMLDQARVRARELNQRGALFPWRTINGEEASAYYAAGTAQYHINADIVYALRKYVEVTGDVKFLQKEGAEILIETARLWASLGFYSPRHEGRFCINSVTGPDEYNTVVNNNAYTNLMARENLRYAAATLRWLQQEHPDRVADLQHETELDLAEIEEWQRAADSMFIPYDEEMRIHLQDNDFLDREVWDFENVPADKYPLLLHFHPLVIYRHQVIKQADIVLAMFLLGNEFSLDQIRRNFDYYDPLTTGDSSLSVSVQATMAFDLGYLRKAREYVEYAFLMDLADVHGNVKDGCHIASMGGTWIAMVYGAAGMRDYHGQLSFNPRFGERMRGVRFSLLIRGQRLTVHIDKAAACVTYHLEEGQGLEILHRHEALRLSPGKPVTMAIETTPPKC